MKRQPHVSARQIIEVQPTARPSRPDSRADPHATTKISRAELDAVLNRTKSGTQPVVRVDEAPPESVEDLAGPRDEDGPEITIRKIESVEVDVQGLPVLERPPPVLPTPFLGSFPAPSPIMSLVIPSPITLTPTSPPRALPVVAIAPRRSRLPFILLGAIVFVALIGSFLAGRLSAF